MESIDLGKYLANTPAAKVFFAPNTSDQELVEKAKKKLAESGIADNKIQINYDTQLLSTGDLYISYDPPDLVVRVVYDKKPNGVVKMKSTAMIKL